MKRPNVIVIVSDTYRPDYIAGNGRQDLVTPELDAWLKRSITFDRASVSSFPTIPMRTDWFTGRFSHLRHGWKDLDPKAVTLPGVLGRAGYVTQFIGDNTHMLRGNFYKPFNGFAFLRGHEGDVPLTRTNDPVRKVVANSRKTRMDYGNFGQRPSLVDIHAHTNFRRRYEKESQPALVADAACRWLEDNYRGGPFFLWVDFFDVHEPWFPPRYLLDLYHPGYRGAAMPHPNYGPAGAYSREELRNMRARYKGMCTLLSKSVGRMLRVIEDGRLLDDTIVVFMSDHGMYLGERGRTGKSRISPREGNDAFPFYREVASICWSMHVPRAAGVKALKPGSRLPVLAQAPDLMPTLLELCGLEAPREAGIEGVSLVPWLTGRGRGQPRGIAVTTSHMGPGRACRRPTVTDGRHTLVVGDEPGGGRSELYDDRRDPWQRRNVLPARRAAAERLHGRLLDRLRRAGTDARSMEHLSAAAVGLGGRRDRARRHRVGRRGAPDHT